jgi:hypothetical protein
MESAEFANSFRMPEGTKHEFAKAVYCLSRQSELSPEDVVRLVDQFDDLRTQALEAYADLALDAVSVRPSVPVLFHPDAFALTWPRIGD